MQSTHDAAAKFHAELQAFGFKEGHKGPHFLEVLWRGSDMRLQMST